MCADTMHFMEGTRIITDFDVWKGLLESVALDTER